MFKFWADEYFAYLDAQRDILVVLVTDTDVERLDIGWWSEPEATASALLRNAVPPTLRC